MKRTLLSLVAMVTFSLTSFGQAPEGFKYQAVVRDADNTILNNQTIGMRMTIQQGSIGGTAVYTETFVPVTNTYGLVDLEIGTGTTTDDFSAIDWSNGPYFMETAIDVTGGTSYVAMGASQLMSVPYALYAKMAEKVMNDQVDDADNDPTNEIETWGTLSGIPTDIADGDDVDDADSDPENELQDWDTLPNIPFDFSDNVDDVNDADADPMNEIQTIGLSGADLSISGGNTINLSGVDTDNQTLSLSSGILTISGGNSTDLNVLSDHDWYLEDSSTTVPTSISDNIYTNGSVGIGDSNPSERLSVYPDTDVSAEIGRAHIGAVGHQNWAGFSHVDVNTTGSYALLQNGNGLTILNSAAGQNINIRNNNIDKAVFKSNGNFGVGTTNPDSKVEVVGDVRLNGNNAGIIYENKETNKEWRLVYSDGFESGTEGWVANGALSTGNAGLNRQSANVAGLVGHFIRPNDNNHTLKKQFDTSGLSYTEVKVEFNYLFLDSWDGEMGWLAVMSAEGGNPTSIWNRGHNHDSADLELNGTTYNVSFFGNGSFSDSKIRGQAQFSWSGGGFWLEFGANLDSGISDETFGVDNVMIYVR